MDCTFFSRWQKRPPRKVLNEAAVDQIIRERRGDIPLAELMALVTA